MTSIPTDLADLEAKAARGERFSRGDAERVLASVDLIGVGMLGDSARRRLSGDDVTFGRVCEVSGAGDLPARGSAGEVRLVGSPSSVEAACARVCQAKAIAGSAVVTGFSATDLLDLCRRNLAALADCASKLSAEGLEAVAACPIDEFAAAEEALDVVRALVTGGLGVWRLTVNRASLESRLDLAQRAATIQHETGAVRAFAPLPRVDSADVPSTGYDDVRTIAVTRLVCAGIPVIQVDWPLYGPKLAQVALLYGANDIDGVAAVDALELGHRRSPVEDVSRQIRAASSVPVERNGRYERLS